VSPTARRSNRSIQRPLLNIVQKTLEVEATDRFARALVPETFHINECDTVILLKVDIVMFISAKQQDAGAHIYFIWFEGFLG
jgi:hypothetical protein